METTQKIVSKSFDKESNTLKASWEVEGFNWLYPSGAQSDLIAIDDSSPIKWRLGLRTIPANIYLELKEGREFGFEYSVSSHRRYTTGEVSENFVRRKCIGAECQYKGGFFPTHIFVDLEIIYPMAAIKPILTKPIGFNPEKGVFRFPKETRNLFCDVMTMAERYGVGDVKKYLGQILINSIDNNNVVKILIASDMNHSEEVKKAALEFIKNSVGKMADFKQLLTPIHWHLVTELFKNNRK